MKHFRSYSSFMWWQLMIPLHLVRTMSQGTPPSAQRGRCRRGDVPANVASDVTNTTPAAFLHGVDDDNNSQKSRQAASKPFTHPRRPSFLPSAIGNTQKWGTVFTHQHSSNQSISPLRDSLRFTQQTYAVHTQRTATIMNALHRNRHNLLT